MVRRSRVAAPGAPVRVGIARDAAFGFYYPGDLEALHDAGAELVAFDALHDERLPPSGRPVHRRRIPRNAHGRAGGEPRPARRAARGDRCRTAGLRRVRRTDVPRAQHRMERAPRRDGRRAPGRHRHARASRRPRLRAPARNRPRVVAGAADPAKPRSSGRTNFTTRASRTWRRMSGSPTTSSAATASTAGTTASCTGTCSRPTRTCATSPAITGRGASSSSSGAANGSPPRPRTPSPDRSTNNAACRWREVGIGR